jgi:hypothetical protein
VLLFLCIYLLSILGVWVHIPAARRFGLGSVCLCLIFLPHLPFFVQCTHSGVIHRGPWKTCEGRGKARLAKALDLIEIQERLRDCVPTPLLVCIDRYTLQDCMAIINLTIEKIYKHHIPNIQMKNFIFCFESFSCCALTPCFTRILQPGLRKVLC